MRAVNVTGLLFARQRFGRAQPVVANRDVDHRARSRGAVGVSGDPLSDQSAAGGVGARGRSASRQRVGGQWISKGQVRSGRRDRQEPDVTAHSRISAARQFRAAIVAGTMRLLVVEDEQRLAAGLRKGLEAEGSRSSRPHGTDGLWMARENPFDAIVLDVMLPGANGYQVCRTLRREGNWTPILMLTAKIGVWDEVEGLDTGADDYLAKPFSYVVLVARLRALSRRGARPRPTVLEAGELRLDPAARQVWLAARRSI